MNIEYIFGTPIFNDYLNVDVKLLEEYSYQLKQKSEGRRISNRLGWQSNDLNKSQKEIEPLFFLIEKKLDNILKISDLKKNVTLNISNIWININKKYSYNIQHFHPFSYYSGVFYIKAPENSGLITFINPSQTQECMLYRYKNYFDKLNHFISSDWCYSPKSGLLLLFPSWIQHQVGQNLSDSDRISIAFNVTLEFN